MKLIVSDFDETYYTNNIELDTKINNKFINKFRKNNNLFMLSSGRSFKSLKEMVTKYNIKYDYLSCCDGSILYDNKDNIIIKYSLNPDIINKFISLKKYANINRIQYSYEDDYYPSFKDNNLIGINIVIDNDKITNRFKKKFKLLNKEYPNYDFLVYAHDDVTFFCIKNNGINKSSTIKYLEKELNLDYNDIYVIGDNDNDYPMLLYYNSYYIGEVSKDIEKVCIKGFNNFYEIESEIKE